MPMQFFTIPIADPQAATETLNAFLAAHRVVHVERHYGSRQGKSQAA